MTSNPFLVEPVPPPPADNESMTPRDWMELLGNDWPGSNRNSGREEAPTEDDVVQLEKQLSEASDELEKEMQSEQQHDGSDTRSDYSSMQPGASRADSPHSEDADTPPHQQYPYALSTYKPPKTKQAWTREEDMIILGGVSTFGNKWSKIVAQLPVHRTDDAVRTAIASQHHTTQTPLVPTSTEQAAKDFVRLWRVRFEDPGPPSAREPPENHKH